MSVRAFLIPILFLFSPRFCKSPPKGPILNTCHLSIYPSIIHPSIHPPSKKKNWVAREKLEHSNSAQFQFNQALSALRNVSFFLGALRTILCGGSKNLFLRLLLPSFDTIHSHPEARIFGESPQQHIYLVSSLSFFLIPRGLIGGNWVLSSTVLRQKSYSSFFFVIRRGYYPISII